MTSHPFRCVGEPLRPPCGLSCQSRPGSTIPSRIDRYCAPWSDGRVHWEGTSMADLKTAFELASKDIQGLSERPDNDTLLRLYGLYKQGSEGDVKGDKPGFFDFVGTAKYEAWAKLKGTSQDDAMQKYVDLVKKLTA